MTVCINNLDQLGVIIFMLAHNFILPLFCLFSFFVLYNIFRARRGRPIFLRKIPGLEMIEKVCGRATEQDRPIMFNPGTDDLSVQLFCSLAVMGHVVRLAAKLYMPVHVPIARPLAYAMAEEYWKDGYAAAGREGLYAVEDHMRFLSDNQSAYAASVAGWIKRENIGANLIFGGYGYEAMVIAEAGQQAGAFQIACTHSFYQVPFFLVACDHTVFGEEFYAAGAYFSKDPVLTGSLVGQDWSKLLLLIIMVLGILIFTFLQQDWIRILLT